MSIRFINHASVLISNDTCGLLSDPWYSGNSFNKGWNLLYENEKNEICKILESTNYIWISHEHPDHFSIKFFKEYADIIKRKEIRILFQDTKDKRVITFLKKNNYLVKELSINKKTQLNKDFKVTCFKDGSYDSGLLIECNGKKILNLNDCVIRSTKRAKEVYKITGRVDILLTQFSYAAWKGGKERIDWRMDAAKDKIQNIKLQIEYFKPKYTIPFASYIYFSNEENKYLNDSINTPKKIHRELNSINSQIIIMKPGDIFGGKKENYCLDSSITYWENLFNSIESRYFNTYESISFKKLKEKFDSYRQRIINNNYLYLMKFIKFISPISIFKPITIGLKDLSLTVEIDYIKNKFHICNTSPMIIMHSESLAFILGNQYGFDTLTVNGCFEEGYESGFMLAAKTLGIESLNNNGIYFTPKIILEKELIFRLLSQLKNITERLKSNRVK